MKTCESCFSSFTNTIMYKLPHDQYLCDECFEYAQDHEFFETDDAEVTIKKQHYEYEEES